jgi:hypothetical protein
MSPAKSAATSQPAASAIQPKTRATVPPTFDGCPASVTEVFASGIRGDPQAVQYALTPR